MFEHKGIKIEVMDNGNFRAVVNGNAEVAASLSAIKKRIDGASRFESFAALIPQSYGPNPFTEVRVTGITKAKGKKTSWNEDKFSCEGYGDASTVVIDTPEARAALAEIRQIEDDTDRAVKQLRAEATAKQNALRQQLQYRKCPQ